MLDKYDEAIRTAEGNIRTQREFIRNLAFSNRYTLEWNDADPEELLKATIETTREYKYFDMNIRIIKLPFWQ